MEKCNGYGECSLQCDNNGYSKNYDILCTHNCIPVKCQNFEICGYSFQKCILVVGDRVFQFVEVRKSHRSDS